MRPRFRKHLLVVLSLSILLVILTAITAIAALRATATDSDRAVHAFADDLARARALRNESRHVTAATRDRLAGSEHRAELAAARTAFVSAPELDARYDDFVRSARGELDAALARARRLGARAQLTLLLLALIAIAVSAGLVAAFARELDAISERLAIATAAKAREGDVTLSTEPRVLQ